MNQLKRLVAVAAVGTSLFSAVLLGAKKLLPIRSFRLHFAEQDPGAYLIGNPQKGKAALFVSTKYRPGRSKLLPFLSGALWALLGLLSRKKQSTHGSSFFPA